MRKGRKRNLEREAEAKKLRMQGKSLTQIAKEMGYEGNGSVWNYLNRPN
jgi:DNA-binding CsgD family transcriptional regulator